MAKVTITADGVAEVFEFDGTRRPLSEAIALETALGTRYGEWEADLQAGSARALCAYIWLVWRRNGRLAELADVLDGRPEIDLNGFSVEPDDGPEPGPTSPGSSPAEAPDPSSSTSGATSRRSAR